MSGGFLLKTRPSHAWVYRCRVTNVVDGDTVDVVIDAGFRATRTERIRLLWVNTPERKGATRAAGDAAKQYVEQWVKSEEEWPLLIVTRKADAFGRYLGVLWRESDGVCLNAELLSLGHAVPFEE